MMAASLRSVLGTLTGRTDLQIVTSSIIETGTLTDVSDELAFMSPSATFPSNSSAIPLNNIDAVFVPNI